MADLDLSCLLRRLGPLLERAGELGADQLMEKLPALSRQRLHELLREEIVRSLAISGHCTRVTVEERWVVSPEGEAVLHEGRNVSQVQS